MSTKNPHPKILYIFPYSGSFGFCTGQLNYLQKCGFHAAMCSPPGKELNQIAAEENVSDVFAIPSICRNINPLKDIISVWKLYRLMRRYKPDIVISGMAKTGLLGGLASAAARVPVRIFQRHGVVADLKNPLMNGIMHFCEWMSCFLSTETWCVAPSLIEYYKSKHLVPKKNVAFLQGSCNGLNLQRFLYSAEYLKEAKQLAVTYNITPDNKIVGFCGRINQEVKGINELIAAFEIIVQRHPETKLLLVGAYDEQWPLSETVRNTIENHPNIITVGYTPTPALFLCLMNIFVFPSHREGFGYAPLEASAMGIPVVGTKIPGLVDAVADKQTGTLVPIGDVPALVEAVEYYLENPDIAIQHGINGSIRAARDFRPQDIWKAYLNELTSLLHKKGIDFTPNEIEEAPPVDLAKHEQELRQWLAVKANLLHNSDIKTVASLYQVPPDKITQLLSEIQN